MEILREMIQKNTRQKAAEWIPIKQRIKGQASAEQTVTDRAASVSGDETFAEQTVTDRVSADRASVERMFCRIFWCLAVVLFSLLFYYELGETGANSGELTDEHIYLRKISPLIQMILLGAGLLLLEWYGKLERVFDTRKKRNILTAALCVLAVLFGIYWVTATKTYPQADQDYILLHAREIQAGKYWGLEDGQYLAVYPQQLGMVTLLRGFHILFGNKDYLAFQYFTALMLPLIILSGRKAVRYLAKDNARAELFYLLFVFTCFPMYGYTPFVYGDLCSLEIGMLAVWAFLSCMENFRIRKLFWLGTSIGLAVFLRENMLILAIAMGCVLIVRLWSGASKRKHTAVIGGALLLGILIFESALKLAYSDIRDKEADALPVITSVVMGLNDDYGYAGWDNFYGLNLFEECNRDAELTSERAMEDFRSYLNLYRMDPSYMVDFFSRKMIAQWNAPMYQCIVANNKVVSEQGKIAKNIYEKGILYRLVNGYMGVYQLILYASILFLLLSKCRKWASIENYVLLIAVFGGFLFSLIWEAKTRYVFPYLLMQLPYMAVGVNELLQYFEAKAMNRKS